MSGNNLTCSNNGFQFNSTNCSCIPGFSGLNCSIPFINNYQGVWTFFQVFYTLCYSIVLLMNIFHFYRYYSKELGSFKRKLIRQIKSPKYLIMYNLFVISISRIVYLSVDPYKQRQIFNLLQERIIHDMIYSSFFSIAFITFFVWNGLFVAFKKSQKDKNRAKSICNDKFSVVQIIIAIVLVFVYPVQFYLSSTKESQYSSYIFSGFLFISLVVIFTFSLILLKFKWGLTSNLEVQVRDLNYSLSINHHKNYYKRNS